MSNQTTYTLTISLPSDGAARKLRAALKCLLRSFGIKCVSVEEVKP